MGIMRAINDMDFPDQGKKFNFIGAAYLNELKFFNGNSISIFKKGNSSILTLFKVRILVFS